jgi:hypothetical protein
MRRIFAAAYAHRSAGPGLPAIAPQTLTRRMSWMQKAAMEALEAVRPLPPDLPVYFATQFGEIDATLAVADAILSRQLPVSPTAFQHSVHNAGPGYLMIATGSRAPSLTVSSGFASFDKLLFWAFHELRQGHRGEVLLAQAAERVEDVATCELLHLSTDHSYASTGAELLSATRLTSRAALASAVAELGPGARQEFHESDNAVAPSPLRLDRTDGNFHRILTSFVRETADEFPFEAFVSSWSRPG